MENRAQTFGRVFEEVLDYPPDFKHRLAVQNLGVYERIEREGKIVASGSDIYTQDFAYALTLAVIVGEFGHFAFNDHFLLEMALPEREITVESGECVPLPTFIGLINDYKERIDSALRAIYSTEKEEHTLEFCTALEQTFGQIPPDARRMEAYEYVSSGFLY